MLANEIMAKAVVASDNLGKKGMNVPVLILSHAGFRKTSTISLLAEYLDYNLITLIPSQNSYDDITGIETVDEESKRNNTTKRLMPSWLFRLNRMAANGRRNLLFIDELTTCDPLLQGPLLNVIFSRSLGEYALPENTLIVAGGNYPSDLNNSFEMFVPLVNRFMLVNLQKDDMSISEILDEEFESLESKEQIGEYLRIAESDSKSTDYGLVRTWLERNMRFTSDVRVVTDPEIGMLGVTSARSLSYSAKFIREYVSMWSDDLWTRIAGDTLGICEEKSKAWRVLLYSAFDSFSSKKASSPMEEVLNAIGSEEYDKAVAYLSKMNVRELTLTQLNKLTSALKAKTKEGKIPQPKLTNLLALIQ